MTNGKEKLISALLNCFQRIDNKEPNTEKLQYMKEALPSMTEDESQELIIRLLRRCKYEPTIAEIMDEWRTLKRCQRAIFVPQQREDRRVFSPKIAKLLADTRRAIQRGEAVPGVVVDSMLITFARSFFPGISLETITRNKLELSCCLMEQQRELEENCRYRTVPVMDSDGEITCCMRKIV